MTSVSRQKWFQVIFEESLFPEDASIFVIADSNHSFLIQTIKCTLIKSKSGDRTVIDFNTMRYSIRNPSEPVSTKLYSASRSFAGKPSASNQYSEMRFNKVTNDLFLYNFNKERMAIINLEGKTFEIITDVPKGIYLVLANKQIHIINQHHYHCIGLIKKDEFGDKVFSKSHNTLSPVLQFHFIDQLRGGKAFYISSKKCILLLGGRRTLSQFQKHPWIYSMVTQEWRQVGNISLELMNFHAELSSNQRYMIIFGGQSPIEGETAAPYSIPDTVVTENILVLDMKNENEWKLKECEIPYKIPPTFVCRTGGVDSNDEKLVFGYIRDCFKQREFESIQLPPMYLMKMIEEKYNTETFHFIDTRDRWEIYLKDILDAVC